MSALPIRAASRKSRLTKPTPRRLPPRSTPKKRSLPAPSLRQKLPAPKPSQSPLPLSASSARKQAARKPNASPSPKPKPKPARQPTSNSSPTASSTSTPAQAQDESAVASLNIAKSSSVNSKAASLASPKHGISKPTSVVAATRIRPRAVKQKRRGMVEDVSKSGTELRKMRMKEFLYDSGHGMRMKSTVRKEEQQKMQPKAKKRKRKSDAEVSGETRAIKDKPASSQALVQPSTTPLAPTVTLDKDGKIIVNTSSLVYTPSVTRPDLAGYTERGEDDAKITVCSFKKRSIRRRWTHEETKKFYRALRACGLDFSMMAGFFPKRSRMELKRKYKREEKEHSDLVKLALDLRCALPLEALDVRAADEGHQIEDAEAEEATGAQKRNRHKGGRGKEKGVSSKSSKPKRGASTKKKQKTSPSKRSKKCNGTEKTATKSSEKSSESRAASSSRTIATKRKSKPKAQAKPKATTAPSRSKQLQRRKPQPKPKPKPKSTRKPSSSAARSRKQNERSKTRSASVSQISKETDGSNNVAPRVPESIAATEVETSETSKPMPNTENGKQQADEEEKVNKTAEENDEEEEEEEDDATGDSSDEEVSKLAQILTRGKSRAVEHDFEGSDED